MRKRHAGFRYMGMEHLLLGLLHDPDCGAYRIVSNAYPEVTVERLRAESLRLLRNYPQSGDSESHTPRS